MLRFEDYASALGAAAGWAENRVPLLDYPELDLNTTYYYRWRLFREHIARLEGRTVLTEFLPNCEAGAAPTLHCLRMTACAEGFHIAYVTMHEFARAEALYPVLFLQDGEPGSLSPRGPDGPGSR